MKSLELFIIIIYLWYEQKFYHQLHISNRINKSRVLESNYFINYLLEVDLNTVPNSGVHLIKRN